MVVPKTISVMLEVVIQRNAGSPQVAFRGKAPVKVPQKLRVLMNA